MKTEIICITDRSGSMSSIRSDAEGGFNQFIEDQKKVAGEARVTSIGTRSMYDSVSAQTANLRADPKKNT